MENNEIISNLNNMTNRDDGYNLIKLISKKQLWTILSDLDIGFSKNDNIKKLSDIIIENTIGYRLRSSAIQNYKTK